MTISSDTQRAFRDALGSFATGVTIATTLDESSRPVGVTASSFNSVSLDPPLVLWSLAKSSLSKDAFCSSGHFAVHVLSANQRDLSDRFARSGDDKFGGVEWTSGALGSPLFDNHAAVFECKTRHQYDGGDHIILVGEVVSSVATDKAPLLFHAGRYAESRPRSDVEELTPVTLESGQAGDDFLHQLISKAHDQTSRQTLEELAELEASIEGHFIPDEIAEAKRVLRRIIDLTQ